MVNAKRERNRANAGVEESVLYLAVRSGFPSLVMLLIRYGADVNALSTDDWEKRTPLHAAAIADNTDLAELLLENGAEVMKAEYVL
jgi:ankyrin repeat protein